MGKSGEDYYKLKEDRVFFGEYSISFAKEKNRLALPAKIRKQIEDKEIVLTRGFDGCVSGYGKKEWQKSASKQLEIPITEKQGRNIRRYLFSRATIVKYDQQGRAVIPQPLIDYAQLKSEIVVVGAGDHFEIWDKNKWQKYLNTHQYFYKQRSNI
ncbi:division/cell wall cluster transcriptional repressor MraZ [Candidatus Shapirobacteria bacterium CG09_land_8_20_14_0_10_38_17]|uniref:Transcriptional regulator MraZ n=1 Tax=Candidatus Shapirobacteria bacterium CG09_land_8_20_14_0_10_38_17 TaxID=1974884 RepID=A0A2H0WRD5_9BACT|nr:MAG: division/cell wall cluster transcriptional repressor MraZ [Candidatus Shapirobacteria bacterium CG09_land_8_20_14_0_10_38_17]